MKQAAGSGLGCAASSSMRAPSHNHMCAGLSAATAREADFRESSSSCSCCFKYLDCKRRAFGCTARFQISVQESNASLFCICSLQLCAQYVRHFLLYDMKGWQQIHGSSYSSEIRWGMVPDSKQVILSKSCIWPRSE